MRLALGLALLLSMTPMIGEPPVPFPDLAPLEKEVGEQLAAAQQRLTALASAAGPRAQGLAAAYGDLGMLYHAYGLREPAEACYRNAARLAPGDSRWPHALGLLLQEGGRLDEAAAAFERALRLQGTDVAALVHRGEIARLQGRSEEAEDWLRKALAVDPSCAAARAILGQTALDRRDFTAAVKRLEAALAAVPEANRLHYLLAQAYRGLGEPAKAQEHLAKAGQVGVRPADPFADEIEALRTGERVRLARARTAYQNGRYGEAAALYRTVVADRPDRVEARINLAATLVQLGDRAAAVAELKEALRRDPASPTAHFNLGTLLALEGPSAEAREHLAAAAAALPQDAEAHRALAEILRNSGRPEEALAEYARAVAIDPADERARLGEAETLVRLERYQPARERLEEGLRVLPRHGLLTHGLARLLAACPDRSLRDGARARDLAFAVWQAQPTAGHAETVALANAETGDCAEAARWQRIALEAAGSLPGKIQEMKARLATYEKRAPCRP
ncbi:MAG: tetratricopeptide repeat protein [Acidobacteria bacterium]|nr:tetratricopeptide repeat protein [Acidobacteriota bacterium]